MEKEYKGTNGTLSLTDTGVVIRKQGVMGFLLGGAVRGDKSIPYSSIVAVQYKKAGLMAGYLQLTLLGGSEPKGGVLQAVKDENTITFNSAKTSVLFEDAKLLIEQRIHQSKGNTMSNADELKKYAELQTSGVISKEEFEAKKKQILGI